MTDVRDRLYASYLTDFKAHEERHDPERYAAAVEAHYGAWLRQVDPTAPVLELGCGPGVFLDELRRRGFTAVEGIDLAPEQVAAAQARGLPVRVQDAFDALEDKRSYGLIVAIDVIEHLELDELLRLLLMTRQRLLPNGALLLRTPNGQGLFPGQVVYGDLTHRTILNPDSLTHALRVAGFKEIEVCEAGPPPDRPLRRALWALLRHAVTVARLVETGKRQRVWTETMLCLARRS